MDIAHIIDIIDDMDEFIQRNGIITNKILIRSKLRLLNNYTPLGKTKSVIRGLLIRLNRLTGVELTIRVLDIIKTFVISKNMTKPIRKQIVTRFVKPKDMLNWFTDISYPLKISVPHAQVVASRF